MPTQTFFNLPEAKQQIIIEKSLEQFADHSYEAVSISRIVQEARIAKGSFYQYFEGKEDLYLYLVDIGIARQKSFIENADLPPIENGFFPYLRSLLKTSLDFQISHPHFTQILFRLPNYGDIPFRDEVFHRTKAVSIAFIKEKIEYAIALGQLPKYLNPDMVAFMIVTLGNELRQFIPRHLGIKVGKLVKEDTPLDVNAINQTLDDFVSTLEKGIGKD
ncbi:TetR/AcrR family transcriptional regulator [Cyanobacterium aponinum FACHB-4101]|uniref:TetR/AcrR family transcriptional regulator n=1 Tax=Cyanobacterium aponinum TaxID=379064 RepID=UPI001680A939|nr:TetR/AcrR family transcriptional regulator [Cyanobacterium aponinum]MBD2393304.1 TetR/AcrR family transcriptional regulator [Cyanobacterium aponinum FACHB-4101]